MYFIFQVREYGYKAGAPEGCGAHQASTETDPRHIVQWRTDMEGSVKGQQGQDPRWPRSRTQPQLPRRRVSFDPPQVLVVLKKFDIYITKLA